MSALVYHHLFISASVGVVRSEHAVYVCVCGSGPTL